MRHPSCLFEVSVHLRDKNGNFLSTPTNEYRASDDGEGVRWVCRRGVSKRKSGGEFGVCIRNLTSSVLEFVLSVDGAAARYDRESFLMYPPGFLLEGGQSGFISGYTVKERLVVPFRFGGPPKEARRRLGEPSWWGRNRIGIIVFTSGDETGRPGGELTRFDRRWMSPPPWFEKKPREHWSVFGSFRRRDKLMPAASATFIYTTADNLRRLGIVVRPDENELPDALRRLKDVNPFERGRLLSPAPPVGGKKPTMADVAFAVGEVAAIKGRQHSASELNQEVSLRRRRLEACGATKKQLKIFDRLVRKAPSGPVTNRDGS